MLFGSLMCGATYVVGSIFTSMTAPEHSAQDRKRQLDSLPYDARHVASGQQVRLSTMIRETVDSADAGASTDKHWQAAMR
jgi:hypothetical protein